MDAFGHVNNAAYFRYLETSRVELLRRVGWMCVEAGTSAEAARTVEGVGVILHSVRARFRAPVEFPDTLTVTARVVSIETDRFTLAHEVWSERLGVMAAEGEGIVVAYDYRRASKAPIPEVMRSRLEAMRGL